MEKVTIHYKELIDPALHRSAAMPITKLILNDADAIEASHFLTSILLQAHVTSEDEAVEFLKFLKVMVVKMGDRDNKDTPTLAQLIRTMFQVSENTGMKMDSHVVKKGSDVVVTVD